MIFIVAGFCIMLYSLNHFKRGLCIYLAFKLILVTNITLLSIPGLPLLTLEDFMNIVFVFLFLYRRKKNGYGNAKYGLPWQLPFIMLTVSILLSSICSIAGITSELSVFIKYLFGDILIIYVTWETIETKDDFEFLYKLIIWIFLFSCVYGLFEYAIQTNPIKLYEATLNTDATKQILFDYSTTERGYRISSIFEHSIGAGINWGIYVAFVLYNNVSGNRKMPYRFLSVITAVLCVICIVLTKMRTPLVFLIIACFGSFNFKSKKTYFSFTIVLAAIVLVLLNIDESSDIYRVISSLLSSKSTSSVGGSTFDGRINQLRIAIDLLSSSFVFGLGSKYQLGLSYASYAGIYGSEGLLLYVLPSFGLLGLCSYIYYFLYSIVKIPRYFKSKQLCFLMLAYLVSYLVSSLPGMKISLLYVFAFYLIKSSSKYRMYNGEKKVVLRKGFITRIY